MRTELRKSTAELWSPAEEADSDQDHAEAIDALRSTKTYVLVTVHPQGMALRTGLSGTVVDAIKLQQGTVHVAATLEGMIRDRLIPLVESAQEGGDGS